MWAFCKISKPVPMLVCLITAESFCIRSYTCVVFCREQQELLASELAKNSESFSPRPEPYHDDHEGDGGQGDAQTERPTEPVSIHFPFVSFPGNLSTVKLSYIDHL